LDYFGARYYSSAQGRFTSVDPFEIAMDAEDEDEVLAFLSDPRSWNKYAYTYNNPLRFVDPDGQRPQDSFHNRLDKAVRDQGAGRISEKQYWESMRGPALGGTAGLAVIGGVAGGARMASAILLWAARNPDKIQQIAQEMAQASTGSPAPAPTLGTPLSKIFGVTDEVIASGGFVQGRLGDALIGGQFTKSGDKLTAGIFGAYANNSPLGVLHKLVNSIKDFARAQGAKTIELQAIAVINKDLEKALIKQGFEKKTVLVDGQKVEAYVKTIRLK
jgi:RHS repeat-associated protein